MVVIIGEALGVQDDAKDDTAARRRQLVAWPATYPHLVSSE
jgi:hypothetical protein